MSIFEDGLLGLKVAGLHTLRAAQVRDGHFQMLADSPALALLIFISLLFASRLVFGKQRGILWCFASMQCTEAAEIAKG